MRSTKRMTTVLRGFFHMPWSCWDWPYGLSSEGYGRLTIDGRRWYAHRWSFTQHVHAIPSKLQIDHLCRNRACFNPYHLRAVTAQQNMENLGLRASNKVGYPGVFYRTDRKKYIAYTDHEGTRRYLGHYDTAEEAWSVVFKARKEAGFLG